MITPDYVEKGRLVYIPSGSTLIVRDDDATGFYIERYVKIEKPANCIIMSSEVKNNLCEILYCGKLWHVKVSEAYAVYGEDYKVKGESAC